MTTSTATWLQSYDWVNAALVLIVEGLDFAFTNHDDLTGLSSAWSASTDSSWTTVRGGLDVSGSVERRIEIFNAQIRPSSLTFSILDYADVLLPLMYGEARTDINRADLGVTLSSSDLLVAPQAATTTLSQGGVDEIYIGTETILTTLGTPVAWFVGSRGFRSIGGTSTTDNEFGRPHEVNETTGDRPEITDTPTAFYNRGVALFLCHKLQDGTWSSGFPGSHLNDAELLWTGRIKAWDEDGHGTISMDCVEVTERLQTSLLSKQFTGHLSRGIIPLTEDTEMMVRASSLLFDLTFTGLDVGTTYQDGFTSWTSTGDLMSVDEIVSAINEQLVSLFVTSAGTYGPVGASVYLAGPDADGKITYGVGWPTAITVPLVSTQTVKVELYLPVRIWELLGFGNQLFATISEKRSVVAGTNFIFPQTDARVVGEGTPATAIIKVDGTLEVLPDSALSSYVGFTPQTNVPPQIDANSGGDGTIDGFLLIGDDILLAVQQVSATVFKVKRGGVIANNEVFLDGDLSPFFGSRNSVNSLFTPGSGDIPAKQVWLESGAMGDIFLKLMVSTGTEGYNHPDHDIFPAWMGAGIPWTLIDTDSVIGLDDSSYTLLVTKPTPLNKLLESALNFAGKQLAFVEGKITIVSTTTGDNGDPDIVVLTESNKAKKVGAASDEVSDRTPCSRAPTGILNRLTLKYNQDLSGAFKGTITVNATTSQTDYEQISSAVIDGYGIYTDNSLLSDSSLVSWQKNTVASALAEFSKPIAIATRSYDFSLVTKLFPGKRVSLTDNSLVDPTTGSRGVSGILGWCLSTNFDWMTGVGRCEIVFQPSRASGKSNSLGPSAKVDQTVITSGFENGYNSTTKVLALLENEYSVDSTDLSRFAIGDKVHIVNLDPTDGSAPQEWDDTIASLDLVTSRATLTTGLSGYANGSTPIVVTQLATFSNNVAAGTSKTTSAVNVTSGDYLLMVLEQGGATGLDFANAVPAITGGTGAGPGGAGDPAWSLIASRIGLVNAVNVQSFTLGIYAARAAGTVAGTTFTTTYGQTLGSLKCQLFSCTGISTSSPIAQVNNTSGLITTHFEIPFLNAGVTQNTVLGIQSSDTLNSYAGASTTPAGWTRHAGQVFGGGASGFAVQVKSSFATPAPFDWTVSQAATGTYYGYAVELNGVSVNTKPYVMEYSDISTSTVAQRGKSAYLADEISKSTGLAARDAFVWGGDVLNVSTDFIDDAPYQRANLLNDDVGTALSVHKLSTLSDWANTAFCHHKAPIYVNAMFKGGLTVALNDPAYKTVFGPVWVPIDHLGRRLTYKFLATATAGVAGATFRVVTSRQFATGTSFNDPEYIDMDSSAETVSWNRSVAILTAGTNTLTTGFLSQPSTRVRDGVRGCYLTLDVSAGASVKLWSLHVAQVQESL